MTTHRKQDGRGTVIAITSGKGGVGKTNVAINIASSLSRRGYRVGLVDADFGLGNIDVMLGLTPDHHVGHVLAGEKQLDEVVIEGPRGVQIVPASNGIRDLTALNAPQWRHVGRLLRQLASGLDFLFVDTAAGISDNVVQLLALADRVLVVTSFEPAAIVDAYAVIKVFTTEHPRADVGVVVCSARDADEATLVFKQLELASSRFLRRGLRYYGSVVHDPAIRQAVLMQQPIVDHQPDAKASRCFRILADRIAGMAGGGPGLHLVTTHDRASVSSSEEAYRCA